MICPICETSTGELEDVALCGDCLNKAALFDLIERERKQLRDVAKDVLEELEDNTNKSLLELQLRIGRVRGMLNVVLGGLRS